MALEESEDYISGKVSFNPTLEARLGYNDNILSQESQQKSSIVSELQTQLNVIIDNYINLTTLGYRGKYANYLSSSGDNRFDHLLHTKMHHEMMRNLTFDVGAAYQISHEDRGAYYLLSADTSQQSPDEFNVTHLNGLLTLGTNGSKGRLQIGGKQSKKTFVSRPSVTQGRNLKMTEAKAVFIRTISPKTEFTLLGNYAVIDYVSELETSDSRDSVEQSYLAGMRWEYNRLNVGEVNIGYRVRTFSSSSRATSGAIDWRAQWSWSPLRELNVNINSESQFEESVGDSNIIASKKIGIGVSYKLSSKHSLGTSVSGAYKTYPPLTNKDYVFTVGANTAYRINQRVSVGLSYTQIKQTTNREGFSYAVRNILMSVSWAL